MGTHLLNQEQLKQYQEDGYVIVENFFDVEKELLPIMSQVDNLVDELANQLFDAGKIKNKWENEGFYTRLTKLEKEFPGAAVVLHKKGKLPKAMADLWANPRLLDIAQQVLGTGDISGHPVWNLRTKTPNNPLVTVPWHQDAGYMQENCENTEVPTAWIPLIDANLENGCMQVYKRGQREKKLLEHFCCSGQTWYIQIPEEEMKAQLPSDCEIVTCEVPLGGFLLINQLIPHRSLENKSEKIRWSVDLRWMRTGEPAGFFGLKQPIPLRIAKDPAFRPDWATWGMSDRNAIFNEQQKHAEANGDAPIQVVSEDTLTPLISGPWMQRWKITHTNQHTAIFKPNQSEWHKS